MAGWGGDDPQRGFRNDTGTSSRTSSRPAPPTSPAPSACTPPWITWIPSAARPSSATIRPWPPTPRPPAGLKGIRLFGPPDRARRPRQLPAAEVHAHDVVTWPTNAAWPSAAATIAPSRSCSKLGIASTARASFYFYNTERKWTAWWRLSGEIQKFFGHMTVAVAHRLPFADGEVLAAFPGVQRALFRRYHIGGCSSCGFQPGETLEELCARNNVLPVDEVLSHTSAQPRTGREGPDRARNWPTAAARPVDLCWWTCARARNSRP